MQGASNNGSGGDNQAAKRAVALTPAQLAARAMAQSSASGMPSAGSLASLRTERPRRRKTACGRHIAYGLVALSLIAVTAAIMLNLPPAPPIAPLARDKLDEANRANSRLVESLVTAPRQVLIKHLLAQAGALAREGPSKEEYRIYLIARAYCRNDKAVARKIKELKDAPLRSPMNFEETRWMAGVLTGLPSDIGTNWPERSERMELVELRMLADKRLVGNLLFVYRPKNHANTGLILFQSKPKMTIEYLRNRYGAPSDTTFTEVGDTELMTYGRIRLWIRNSKVAAVFMRTDLPAT